MVVAIKEIQASLVDLGANANLVAKFEHLIGGRVIGRPLDEACAIGIARLGKV